MDDIDLGPGVRELRRLRSHQSAQAAANCSSTAKTSSSCVLGVTLGITWATTPSGPITNVARSAPQYVRPYKVGSGAPPALRHYWFVGDSAHRASCIVSTTTVSAFVSYS
jgi:hypothetical protein